MSAEDELYDQLEQAMAEARNSRREAFEDSVRRGKAEKEAIEAIIRRAKAAESSYSELLKEKRQLERQKEEQEEVLQQVQNAMERQKLVIQDLEIMCNSMMRLLNAYTQRDGSRIKLENSLQVAEELRKNQAAQIFSSSATYLPQFISEFSLAEIEKATRNFHPSLKIGEGYGSLYRGLLGQTEVAIRKLHHHGFLPGPPGYQQEINVLGKLRHQNLATLIGACQEVWALIYEYPPNGSLEDRLSCRDNSSPLSWKTRIRIAVELCSVIVFFNSSKPHGIVHGYIKPDNIFLDANLVSKLSGFGSSKRKRKKKLSDFGTCRAHNDNSSSSDIALCHRTDPNGTLGYIDPEFLTTGEPNPKSDVYSFGIILLRLLTGRPALGLANVVQCAKRNLNSLLDTSAGDWPYVQAKQLAHLGLRCAEMNPRNRPDLGLEVLRFLELIRPTSEGASTSMQQIQAPSQFLCPILMDVMKDPHVAADGFTYEAEALKRWLDSGNETSPMTNAQLKHTNLVPNLALRSAIKKWLDQQ